MSDNTERKEKEPDRQTKEIAVVQTLGRPQAIVFFGQSTRLWAKVASSIAQNILSCHDDSLHEVLISQTSIKHVPRLKIL